MNSNNIKQYLIHQIIKSNLRVHIIKYNNNKKNNMISRSNCRNKDSNRSNIIMHKIHLVVMD